MLRFGGRISLLVVPAQADREGAVRRGIRPGACDDGTMEHSRV